MSLEIFSILAFVISAALTALMIPQIILISFKKRLFDPVDERKVHTGMVPRFGGVAFVPSVTITLAFLIGLYCLQEDMFHLQLNLQAKHAFLVCAVMFLYLEGITDDLIKLGYKVKFIFQIVCALILVGAGFYVNSLNGLLGIYDLPLWASFPFTVLLIIFIINAINLIDGIDGLASGLSMVALFFLGCLFVRVNDFFFAMMAFATLGTLVPFFLFNVFGKVKRHKKIFMGDCGSQTIGFILAVLSIHFARIGAVPGFAIPNALVVAFSALMVPCLDVIRVMIGRVRRGKSPFLPDKTHIHHKLLALGMSHRTAMFIILMIDVFFVLINLALMDILDINIVFLMDVVIFTLIQVWISQLIVKKRSIANK